MDRDVGKRLQDPDASRGMRFFKASPHGLQSGVGDVPPCSLVLAEPIRLGVKRDSHVRLADGTVTARTAREAGDDAVEELLPDDLGVEG